MILNINGWLKLMEQRIVYILLTALFFSIPISSTAKSIFLPLAVAAILFLPQSKKNLYAVLTTKWCQSTLLFLFIVLLACLWSPASIEEKLLIFQKFSKLLYLPVLVVGFQERRTRHAALHAFLLAMVITCVVSILKYSGLFSSGVYDYDYVFRNHIMTSFMMSFAAYLSALFCFREQKRNRLVYGILVLLFSFQVLFINGGRVGYLIYLLLMLLLMTQVLSKKERLLGVFTVLALFSLSCYLSPVMQKRVTLLMNEWQILNSNQSTAIGYRLQFQHYAKSLYWKHPIIGNGAGSFTHLFTVENPIPTWDKKLLEPHSQYWLVAAEFGSIGIIGLTLFFGSLSLACRRLRTYGPSALALLLAFLVGNLTDSLLFYSGSGYFFIGMMALFLGEEDISQSREVENTLNQTREDIYV